LRAPALAAFLNSSEVQPRESANAISSSLSDTDSDNGVLRTANLPPKESFIPELSSPDTNRTFGYSQFVSPTGSAHSVVTLV